MTRHAATREPIALTERTRRVIELRRAILEGTYNVDPVEVAAALLKAWRVDGVLAPEARPARDAANMDSMRRFVVAASTSAAQRCEQSA